MTSSGSSPSTTWWSLRTFQGIWSMVRDVATWALGARWGDKLMDAPGAVDVPKLIFVGGLLGLPFVFWADAQYRQMLERGRSRHPSTNGVVPEPQDSTL